eukprot:GHVQ01028178.1.p1 GENE.GHVQ01028178.1~~GHVQ01028178.1.p1  ORF type:complete len:1063 (+),score=133.68 GHVQ01028178.1:160-3348(+)
MSLFSSSQPLRKCRYGVPCSLSGSTPQSASSTTPVGGINAFTGHSPATPRAVWSLATAARQEATCLASDIFSALEEPDRPEENSREGWGIRAWSDLGIERLKTAAAVGSVFIQNVNNLLLVDNDIDGVRIEPCVTAYKAFGYEKEASFCCVGGCSCGIDFGVIKMMPVEEDPEHAGVVIGGVLFQETLDVSVLNLAAVKGVESLLYARLHGYDMYAFNVLCVCPWGLAWIRIVMNVFGKQWRRHRVFLKDFSREGLLNRFLAYIIEQGKHVVRHDSIPIVPFVLNLSTHSTPPPASSTPPDQQQCQQATICFPKVSHERTEKGTTEHLVTPSLSASSTDVSESTATSISTCPSPAPACVVVANSCKLQHTYDHQKDSLVYNNSSACASLSHNLEIDESIDGNTLGRGRIMDSLWKPMVPHTRKAHDSSATWRTFSAPVGCLIDIGLTTMCCCHDYCSQGASTSCRRHDTKHGSELLHISEVTANTCRQAKGLGDPKSDLDGGKTVDEPLGSLAVTASPNTSSDENLSALVVVKWLSPFSRVRLSDAIESWRSVLNTKVATKLQLEFLSWKKRSELLGCFVRIRHGVSCRHFSLGETENRSKLHQLPSAALAMRFLYDISNDIGEVMDRVGRAHRDVTVDSVLWMDAVDSFVVTKWDNLLSSHSIQNSRRSPSRVRKLISGSFAGLAFDAPPRHAATDELEDSSLCLNEGDITASHDEEAIGRDSFQKTTERRHKDTVNVDGSDNTIWEHELCGDHITQSRRQLESGSATCQQFSGLSSGIDDCIQHFGTDLRYPHFYDGTTYAYIVWQLLLTLCLLVVTVENKTERKKSCPSNSNGNHQTSCSPCRRMQSVECWSYSRIQASSSLLQWLPHESYDDDDGHSLHQSGSGDGPRQQRGADRSWTHDAGFSSLAANMKHILRRCLGPAVIRPAVVKRSSGRTASLTRTSEEANRAFSVCTESCADDTNGMQTSSSLWLQIERFLDSAEGVEIHAARMRGELHVSDDTKERRSSIPGVSDDIQGGRDGLLCGSSCCCDKCYATHLDVLRSEAIARDLYSMLRSILP